MKYVIEIPLELSWLVGIYEKKAEIRRSVGGKGTVESEILIALEQQAIQGIETTTTKCMCPNCRHLRQATLERQNSLG